jgi:hypothetical protein
MTLAREREVRWTSQTYEDVRIQYLTRKAGVYCIVRVITFFNTVVTRNSNLHRSTVTLGGMTLQLIWMQHLTQLNH